MTVNDTKSVEELMMSTDINSFPPLEGTVVPLTNMENLDNLPEVLTMKSSIKLSADGTAMAITSLDQLES